MKKAFLLLIFLGITFLSCSDNLDNTIISSQPNGDLILQGQLFAAGMVDGVVGAELVINETYIDHTGNEINVYARLRIPPNSFPNTVNITMVPNVEDLSIQLFPEMVFNRAVKLDFVLTGINLEEFGYTTTGIVDFAYFADNGDVEIVESEQSHVNIPENKIKALNAKLYHFSRYGWIR